MGKNNTEQTVTGADAEAIRTVNVEMSQLRVTLSDLALEKNELKDRLKQIEKAEQKACRSFTSAKAMLRERVLDAGKRLGIDPLKEGWTFNADSLRFFKAQP